MMRMRRAPGPRCVDEGVVQFLLHVVDDSLLEVGWVIAEQTNARCGLLDDLFVPSADCVFGSRQRRFTIRAWSASEISSCSRVLRRSSHPAQFDTPFRTTMCCGQKILVQRHRTETSSPGRENPSAGGAPYWSGMYVHRSCRPATTSLTRRRASGLPAPVGRRRCWVRVREFDSDPGRRSSMVALKFPTAWHHSILAAGLWFVVLLGLQSRASVCFLGARFAKFSQ